MVKTAQTNIIADIQAIPQGRVGKDLRNHIFKLVDYKTWEGYCTLRKKEMTRRLVDYSA